MKEESSSVDMIIRNIRIDGNTTLVDVAIKDDKIIAIDRKLSLIADKEIQAHHVAVPDVIISKKYCGLFCIILLLVISVLI